jgi:penicillin amidase
MPVDASASDVRSALRFPARAPLAALLVLTLQACSTEDPAPAPGGEADGHGDAADDDAPVPRPPQVPTARLTGPATVVRDAWGRPSIQASSRQDAFFLQGYEMARDRFWHINQLRHFIYGTQAEVWGEAFVEDDILMRGLRVREIAARNAAHYATEHPDTHASLQSFAHGVNAWLADAQAQRNGAQMPTDFSRIPGIYDIAPWSPADTLAVGKALVLSQSFQPDLDLLAFAGNTLMPGTFREMFPFTPLFPTHALEEGPSPDSLLSLGGTARNKDNFGLPQALDDEAARAFIRAIRFLTEATGREDGSNTGGSNAFTVAGSLTASGHAMLCNDTHMPIQLPSVLYPVHLYVDGPDGFEVTGVTAPGAPMILLGNTRDMAWGLTNAYGDVTDLYRESFNDEGTAVFFEGREVPLDIREEVIAVRLADGTLDTSRTATLRHVPHHGPILNDLLPPDIGQTLGQFGFTFSVRWTGFADDTDEFVAFERFLTARNVDEGIEALSYFNGGIMNWHLIDAAGDTAYIPAGPYPERPWDITRRPPYLPLDGEGGEEWGPSIPYAQIPRLVRPTKGYTVSANAAIGPWNMDNEPATGDFYFHHFNDLGTRAHRLTLELERMKAEGPIALDQLLALQVDNLSMFATILVPVLLAETETVCGAAPEGDACRALGLLADWDYRQDADSVPSALFNVWMLHFWWETYIDDMNDLVNQLVATELDNGAGRGTAHFLSGRTPPSGRNYFDDRRTRGVEETAGDMARLALGLALEELGTFFGEEDMSAWRWDRIHQLTWQHVVHPELSVGPRGNGSGLRTVNAADFRLAINGELARIPYQQNEAPQIRWCVELDPAAPTVFGRLNGGVAGHEESPHLADQIDGWLADEPLPVPFGFAAALADAVDTRTFETGFPGE